MRASQRHSNVRGRSGKVNPADGRIRGATGASNRRGRSAGHPNFCDYSM